MSDIIYTPPASGGGGTTINPTNNFLPKRQNATTFVDSVLENGSNYLYTNYGGYTGLGLDFLNFVSYLGDWNNLINGTSIVVHDSAQAIYTVNNGVNNGFSLDFNLALYKFGDIGTNSIIGIDSNNRYIQFTVQGGQFGIIDALNGFVEFGNGANLLYLDSANRISVLGDYGGSLNRVYLQIDHNNDIIKTFAGGNPIGLNLNFVGEEYILGDYDFAFNGTTIYVNDSFKEISLNTSGGTIINNCDVLNFNGALTTGSASGPSPLGHLQVTINGTPCVIQLLNP